MIALPPMSPAERAGRLRRRLAEREKLRRKLGGLTAEIKLLRHAVAWDRHYARTAPTPEQEKRREEEYRQREARWRGFLTAYAAGATFTALAVSHRMSTANARTIVIRGARAFASRDRQDDALHPTDRDMLEKHPAWGGWTWWNYERPYAELESKNG